MLVSPIEMSFAFCLFRSAVLDEYGESQCFPLSDRYLASCSEDGGGVYRAERVLTIHYGVSDTNNAVMNRLRSFVLLMRSVRLRPGKGWKHFEKNYDRFVPVIYAISWCPVRIGEPFDKALFMQVAKNAPHFILPLPNTKM